MQGRPPKLFAFALLLVGLTQPADALAAEEPVAIPAPDGGVVTADRYGPARAERGVVLVHGGRYDRTSWTEQAHTLAGAGLLVLAIDLRAVVDSRSGRQSPCLYDAACLSVDVLAAVRFLRGLGAVEVSVIGGSLGGGAAAQAAVDADPGEIASVVLLAPMSIEQPQRMQGRKLFVTSRDDARGDGTPRLPEIRRQYELASDPKELVVLEGAAHAQALFETAQGERLVQEILRFLTAP